MARRWARTKGALTVAGALSLLAGPAHAGNEDELFVGNRASMTGGAVIATVDDGSSTWYNPGGLAAAERDSIDASGSVYSLRFYGIDDYIRSRLGERKDANVRELIAVPTQIGFIRKLTDEVTLGLGYFGPRSADLVLREHLDERAGNVFSQWSVEGIAIYSQYVFGAALGFHLGDRVRMGAGLLANYDALTESASIFGSTSVAGQVERVAQADSLTTQALVGLEPTIGIQADITRRLTLGVSARGPRFSLYNRGSRQTTISTGIVTDTSETLGGRADEDPIVGTRLQLISSGRYYAGLAYRIGRGWIGGGADIQPSLIDRDASIFRETTWNARIGTYQPVSRRLALGAGVFTDRAPAASEQDTFVFSGADFYGGSVGVEVTNRRDLDAGERVDALLFSTTVAFRYSYASGQTLTLLVDPNAPPTEFFREVESDIGIHEVSIYVGSGLYF